jgi:signal transduction histidine kinase
VLPKVLIRNYDQRRLRNLLAVLFLALAIPTVVLIAQAFGQLKWESYYQHRSRAESLTNQIDAEIASAISMAEARGYADFAFLNSAPTAKIQQRSPLAVWPVNEDLPGLIGYFQVDADGRFSTPLVPPVGLNPSDAGLSDDEFRQRQSVAGEIQGILAQNQLVRDRAPVGGRLEGEAEEAPAEITVRYAAAPEVRPGAPGKESAELTESEIPLDEVAVSDAALDTNSAARQSREAGTVLTPEASEPAYSQQAFDQLNQPARIAPADSAGNERDFAEDTPAAKIRANTLGRVRDLKLDDELQKKSEGLKRQLVQADAEDKDVADPVEARARRVEPATAAEALPPATKTVRRDADDRGLTITTFESEIDPYEFSLLDSGHLVLFRNVWRNGNRTIQGLLIEQDRFINTLIESAFRSNTLSDMSSLVIGYNDDVIRMLPGGSYPGVSSSRASDLDGALLYRNRLSSPLDGLELIFTATRLPPGPGAKVLGWTTLVISIVFLGGFIALYRLGLTQIRLAQQQQDFVSAVSHELKTPLTSIRMYGEMLREGWADEAKRKQYYEYIHDESERLTRLISNVLQLAKISRNEPQFNLKPTTVSALMDLIRSKIANQVERAGFRFKLMQEEIPADTSVSIDDDCFAQIIINLVDNAIKFSRNAENKTIEVGCRLTGDKRVEFTVRDHGPGIARDQMKKIFKLFYRTESELTRETVGTGIGLAIVHQLTTAMNGKVDVSNRDQGAQFNVSFAAQ